MLQKIQNISEIVQDNKHRYLSHFHGVGDTVLLRCQLCIIIPIQTPPSFCGNLQANTAMYLEMQILKQSKQKNKDGAYFMKISKLFIKL